MDVEAVGSILGGILENIGNLGTIGIDAGVADLIESEGGGGGDDGEEAGVGTGDQFGFDG